MRRRYEFLLGVLLLSSFTAGCSPVEPADESSKDALIHGSTANDGTFASTVALAGVVGCTGAKIGPSLILTAAHCVTTSSGAVAPYWSPGRKLDLLLRSGPVSAASLTIKAVHIPPRTKVACGSQPCHGDSFIFDSIPDVAVIETREELRGVPVASVDTHPVDVDTEVTLNGYGCTAHDENNAGNVLRVGDSRTAAMGALSRYQFSDGAIANMADNYLLTMTNPAGTTICNGDSGGPVYRKGTAVIVGVNSTSVPSDGVQPEFNWFTRVDGKARYGVAAWLDDLGASMTAPCLPTTCIAVSEN